MITLEKDNLKDEIAKYTKVLVQYGAAWCGNCRMIKPAVNRLVEAQEGVEFIYVDAEKFPESRQLAEVNNLPTFAYFENGVKKNQAQGNKIENVEALLK